MRAFLIGVALFASGCAATTTPEAAPEPSLIVRGDRLFVPARLNGAPIEALLDSGAELSLLDAAAAEAAGLATAGAETARGTGGETQVTFVEGVTLELVGERLDGLTMAVLDLSDIAERLIGGPLSLIAGREIFDAARLRIDIESGVIETVDRAAAPAGVRLETETHNGIQTIPVSVEGGAPVQADFDLGNGSGVLVGGDFADRTGLSAPERIVGRRSGGGIGGAVERERIVLSELEIAGVTFRDVPADIDRTGNAADVNVGVSVLRAFVITTDFAEGAIWLDPK